MKKIVLAVIVAMSAMFSSVGVGYAEENIAVVEKEKNTSTEFTLNVHVDDRYNIMPQNMVFGIYSKDKQFWGARHFWSADNNKDYTLAFEVPEYELGDTLYISALSGAHKTQYADNVYGVGEMIPIKTDTYADELKGSYANVTATPFTAPEVKCFANGWELYFRNPAKLVNGTAMISLEEYLEALGMKSCMKIDEESGRVDVSANGHKVTFFVEGHDMYADGNVTYTDNYPIKVNGAVYVPFRFFVESMGGTIEAQNIDGMLNVRADLEFERKESEIFVADIQSSTNYLVWVSKKDFEVTVFTNDDGPWKEVAVFPCSIGAPETETVTGEYEYFSKESRWSYPNYYVGPIMRFYRGYALHSTLLRYDGSDADARLGKKISHGCVRLAPESINWMVDNVPLYTKIYVTN